MATRKSAATKPARPAIPAYKYAANSRLAELVSKRVPHLLEMESGEAYLAMVSALKDEIEHAFGGGTENLFILETYRRMAPLYSEFEPWHHAEREKLRAPAGGVEYVSVCECGHVREIHRGGFAACTHKSGCSCTTYRKVTKAYERADAPAPAADEGALW